MLMVHVILPGVMATSQSNCVYSIVAIMVILDIDNTQHITILKNQHRSLDDSTCNHVRYGYLVGYSTQANLLQQAPASLKNLLSWLLRRELAYSSSIARTWIWLLLFMMLSLSGMFGSPLDFCSCGGKFSVEYSFTCLKGGFPSLARMQ